VDIFRQPHPWGKLRRYGFPFAAVGVALAVHWALEHLAGPLPPFILFFTAMAVTAMWSGGRGALIATVLSAVIADYFFLPPTYDLGVHEPADVVSLSLFLLNGILFSLVAKWREAREELKAQEERFEVTQRLQALTGALPVGVSFSQDGQCRLVTGNAAMLALFDALPEDNLSASAEDERSLGRRVRFFREGRQLTASDLPLQRAIAENRVVPPTEFEVLLPNGRRWVAEGLGAPIRDARGRVVAGVAVTVDVTDRKRIEDSLRESARALGEANRLKDEFLATLSHELRTPLNAMLGWAHLLQQGTLDEAGTRRAIEIINRNARAQAALVADVLDVSRIISGKLRLEPRRTDLVGVLDAALDAIRPAADARRIAIVASLDDDLIVIGDPDRLQQVLWNLLSNAVKFTPEGGRVQVEGHRKAGGVELSVADTGVGIAPEALPYLFNRFWQADRSPGRRHGGLGLGLAIVRHLVELHGGEVTAESEGAGRGSRFTVSLPAAPAAAATFDRVHPSADVVPDSGPTDARLDGVHVLVVDDEPDARELLLAILSQAGATVTAAGSAAEALEAVQAGPPAVLVSDIAMPDEDGYQLIRKIRKLPTNAGGAIRALAVTAYGREEDRAEALAAGYDAHETKPIHVSQFTTRIAALAGR